LLLVSNIEYEWILDRSIYTNDKNMEANLQCKSTHTIYIYI
jgi:hypothetical protein